MEAFLITICYITVIFFMCWYEKKKFGIVLTPIFMLTVPFSIVLFFSNFLLKYFGFYELNPSVVYIWLFGTLIFFIVGNVFTIGYKYKPIQENEKIKLSIYTFNENNVSFNFKIITLFLVIIEGIAMIFYSFPKIGSLGFKAFEEFFSQGIFGHLLIILSVIVIYLIGKANFKNFLALIDITAILIFLVLAGVKSNLVVTFFAGFLFRIYIGKMNFKLRYVVYSGIIAVIIFFGVYIVDFSIKRGNMVLNINVLKELFMHLGNYVFAGIGGMGEYIKLPYQFNFNEVFNPIDTVFKFLGLIDGEFNNIINEFIKVGPGKTTNVSSIFGEIYIRGGLLMILLYTSFISIIIYNLFVGTRKGNKYSAMAYSYLSMGLVIALFGNNFMRLICLEISVYCYLAYLGSKFLKDIKCIKKVKIYG